MAVEHSRRGTLKTLFPELSSGGGGIARSVAQRIRLHNTSLDQSPGCVTGEVHLAEYRAAALVRRLPNLVCG